MDNPAMQERFKRMMEVRREYGAALKKANEMYEDATRYPIRELVDLFNLQGKLMGADDADRAALGAEFLAAIDSIKLLPNAPDRIYLWPEGKVPTLTDYTDNSEGRYNHDPDYQPYMLEMLLPEDVTPVGAVVTIAGGVHGAGTMNECYQVGLEFNERGYQCFILQCRPNNGPWNSYDTGADAARALRIIRANAEKYRIKPNNIALAGFSNGGITIDFCIEHYSGEQKMTDYYADYQPDEYDAYYGAPDAYLCVYGPRHKGTQYDYTGVVYPPTFFAIGRLDTAIDNFNELYPSLLERGVPMEIHTFAGHPHGYAGWKIIDGKGNPNFDSWLGHADIFLRDLFGEKIFLTEPR